jgi:hypothetical protein
MGKKDFNQFVCIPFCAYFREGSKEEFACRGALLVDELLRCGNLRPDALPEPRRDLDFCGKHDVELYALVCRRCPFQKEDCDFQSEEHRHDAEPCGGYVLLSMLKASGDINPAHLEEMIP